MKDNKGFTLIELAVVIFLIGALTVIAIPKFQDLTEVNIKSASRRLSGTIKYLYSEAVFKKKVHKLSFNIETGEYWVESLEGNEFLVPADPLLRRRKLPDGVYFKDIRTERSSVKAVEGEEEFILFMPTGFVEFAVIHLESESEHYYTLATKPHTGGTVVYDEYLDLIEK